MWKNPNILRKLLPYKTTDAITQPAQMANKVKPARFLNFMVDIGFISWTPDGVNRSNITWLKHPKKNAKET